MRSIPKRLKNSKQPATEVLQVDPAAPGARSQVEMPVEILPSAPKFLGFA